MGSKSTFYVWYILHGYCQRKTNVRNEKKQYLHMQYLLQRCTKMTNDWRWRKENRIRTMMILMHEKKKMMMHDKKIYLDIDAWQEENISTVHLQMKLKKKNIYLSDRNTARTYMKKDICSFSHHINSRTYQFQNFHSHDEHKPILMH